MKNLPTGSLPVILMAAMLLTLTGVRPAQAQTGARETVTLAIGYIPHVQFAPLYVGIEKGFYREAGIDLQIQYGFGIDIFSLLSTGRIDIGLSDSDQLILAGARGLGLKAVFQYYQSYPVTIVAKSDRIMKPSDFAGRTIGTPELYGTSYIGLQLFLKEFGLENKVTVERIGYSQIPSLVNDRIDGAVCFFNNEPILLRKEGVAINTWDVKDYSDMVGASFITSDGIIRRKGDLLRRFSEATARAIAYTLANPDEAVRITARTVGNVETSQEPLLKEVLLATGRLFQAEQGFGHLDPEKYRQSIRILAELGLIPKEFPAETVLHSFR